ncbi:hypothetical protein TNCV_4213381 [Trichonephila clavipes]|nr:hypothetical protein TNCV_4213381 [Trichonephila clavipes]
MSRDSANVLIPNIRVSKENLECDTIPPPGKGLMRWRCIGLGKQYVRLPHDMHVLDKGFLTALREGNCISASLFENYPGAGISLAEGVGSITTNS